jgi:hypothetical protein
MPEAKTLHIDQYLTDFSVQYRNEEMIWREVLPVINVGKRSDKYVVYNKADSYKLVDDTIGPKGLANEVDWGKSDATYAVEDHALSDWLAQEAIDNSDAPISPELDTTGFLNNLIEIAQERRVSAIVFAAGSYPSGNKVTLSGTAQWGQSADDPIKNVQDAVETCFLRANTLIFGAEAWFVFRRLPEILDAVKSSTRFQGSPGGMATASEVAGLFEVERILIGRSRYVTSKEGQTATFARLWGKHMAALHVVKNPSVRSITFGGTFVETNKLVYREFDGKRGVKGAHYFKVGWNSDEVVIANDVGYLITDAVA